jgi:5-methylcytosine-specific restriction endonuclease McrA
MTEEKRLKRNAYMRKWMKDHPVAVAARKRRWILQNIEHVKAQGKARYERMKKENPEHLKAMMKKAQAKRNLKRPWLNANLTEEQRQSKINNSRKWRLSHPGLSAQRSREYKARHVERVRANRRKWAKENPLKNKISHLNNQAKRRQAEGSFTCEEWETKKKEYNYFCSACGKQEPEIKLSVDHIQPLSRGGTNYIDNIQPLCMPCNSRKNAKTIKYEIIALTL